MIKISEQEKLVGIVTVVAPRKGLGRFVEMASKVAGKRDDVKFVIIGWMADQMGEKIFSDLETEAERLGIREKVFFVRNLRDASYYMGDIDVFFMCSVPGTESFGLVVTEAMAAGVPVVAFANDAMPEIIEDRKTGFLVPEGDTTSAAERILEILNDSQLADEFKKAAKDRVFANFDTPVLVSKVEEVFEEILQ